MGRHARLDPRQHRGRIPGARLARDLAAQEQARALGHALLHLLVDAVARRDALQRPELGLGLARIAHLERPHVAHQGLLERLQHLRQHDEALAGDAALAAVDHPRRGGHHGGVLHVRVVEHQIGVAAAELEHGLLEHRPGRRRHLPARRHAAGQGHRRDVRVLDDRLHLAPGQQQGAKQILREAGLLEHLFQRQGAARHVGRMLQDAGVARHQGRRGEAGHLPEREVPRHHRQHHPDRAEHDLGPGPVDVDRHRLQIALRLVRQHVEGMGALFDLGLPLGQGLAHLGGHQLAELALAPAQHRGGGVHQPRARGEIRTAPALPGLARLRHDGLSLVHRVAGIALARLAGRRIDGVEGRGRAGGVVGHGRSPSDAPQPQARKGGCSLTSLAKEKGRRRRRPFHFCFALSAIAYLSAASLIRRARSRWSPCPRSPRPRSPAARSGSPGRRCRRPACRPSARPARDRRAPGGRTGSRPPAAS